ncbi:MAG TPA: N-acetylmuramic acid 6-phosphate etherase [Planctomycetaceae bacterium]|nr:N-acetylmuramic acid 6-phosphate etherase [Planctomycetaceae bacterium]
MLETTEQRNASSTKLDSLTALQIAELMNQQDKLVAEAVEAELKPISEAIQVIHEALRGGGRLVYIGAGTSGRLGVLDASECPPTFNSPPEMVVGLIAGGDRALRTPIEGAEDDPDQASVDLQAIGFSHKDVLMGIATSGRTPYVIGGLQYARSIGAQTIGFVCNANSKMHGEADIMIAPVVGPEVLSGSTRLKSGTATKMVLNMLTTGAMVLLGKTYGNLMVDLRATNSKLRERSVRIVSELTNLDPSDSLELLERCDGEVKTAIVCHLKQVDAMSARERLTASEGHLRTALI